MQISIDSDEAQKENCILASIVSRNGVVQTEWLTSNEARMLSKALNHMADIADAEYKKPSGACSVTA